MSWLDSFLNSGNANQQPQPQQQNQQPEPAAQPTHQPVKSQDPGFQQPADHEPGKEPQQAKSPMDQFSEVFNIEPKKDAQGNVIQEPTGDEPFFSMDREKFEAAVNGMEFIPKTAAEALQKVQAGDLAALPELLNHVMRFGYTQQTQLGQQMMEDLGRNVTARINDRVPEVVNSLGVQNLLAGNSQLNHPAIQPVASALAKQVRAKYPNASAQEVQEQVTSYLKTLGTQFAEDTQEPGPQNQGRNQPTDWSKVFGN